MCYSLLKFISDESVGDDQVGIIFQIKKWNQRRWVDKLVVEVKIKSIKSVKTHSFKHLHGMFLSDN